MLGRCVIPGWKQTERKRPSGNFSPLMDYFVRIPPFFSIIGRSSSSSSLFSAFYTVCKSIMWQEDNETNRLLAAADRLRSFIRHSCANLNSTISFNLSGAFMCRWETSCTAACV